MRKIEKILTLADNALNTAYNNKRIVAEDGSVDKVYNAYIASFPACVIQSGLVPALAFYCGEGAAEGDRKLIIEAIANMLQAKYPEFTNAQTLFRYCVENQVSNEQKEDIINAAIALKLMIRTYKLKDKK